MSLHLTEVLYGLANKNDVLLPIDNIENKVKD